MIVSEGKVAVRHWNSNPAVVEVGGRVYNWEPKYNVSLGWVDESDISAVLSIQVLACCNVHRAKFVLANEFDVSIWNTGHLP